MTHPYQQIVNLLNDIDYDLMEHEHVTTSEEADQVRGVGSALGMKSLLLNADGKLVLVVVRGNQKLHSNKVRKHFGVRDVRFATPEQVLETMGVEIGACYPFGDIPGVEMIVDAGFEGSDMVAFNPAYHTKTIKLKWDDYKKKVQPKLIDVVK